MSAFDPTAVLNDLSLFPYPELAAAADYLEENGFDQAAGVLRVLTGIGGRAVGKLKPAVIQRPKSAGWPLSREEIAWMAFRAAAEIPKHTCLPYDGDTVNVTVTFHTPSSLPKKDTPRRGGTE